MKRARWLEARSSVSIRAIAAKVKSSTFRAAESDGFLLRRVRDNVLEATYVERIEFDEQVIDPFGNEESFRRKIYKTFDFILSTESSNLVLIDPPRSTQSFVARLSEATSFTLAINSLNVDPLRWLQELENSGGGKASVTALQVGGIDLSNGVRGRVLAGGSIDVRDAMNEFVRRRQHIVEKLVASLVLSSGKSMKICLTSGGTAQWGNADSDVFRALDQALTTAAAKARKAAPL